MSDYTPTTEEITAQLSALRKAAQMLIDADVFEVAADSKVKIEHFGGNRYSVNINASFLADNKQIYYLLEALRNREESK